MKTVLFALAWLLTFACCLYGEWREGRPRPGKGARKEGGNNVR